MTITSSTVASAAVGTYRIDPAASTIGFTTYHMFGTGKVRGSFEQVAGNIVVASDPAQTRVSATAPTDAFTTGTPRRDDKVKSAQLLNAKDHPHLVFSSTALEQTDAGWVLRGDLTVVGGTAPLELLVTDLVPTADGMQIKATGKVDRYAHGVRAAKGMVGRWLTLDLAVSALRV